MATSAPGPPAVVTGTLASLELLLAAPGAQAVVLAPAPPEPWHGEVADAVERAQFVVDRCELAGVDLDSFAAWLSGRLPRVGVSPRARDGLCCDLLDLVHLAERVSGVRTFRIRIFTEAPSCRCGFHVDLVPPGAPVWGVLKVYNGAGTSWVEPSAVASMGSFYDWLRRRDRLVRDVAHDGDQWDEVLPPYDTKVPWLDATARIDAVAAGSTIVFRHLTADQHWQDHATDMAWIHTSPTGGPIRLVVNVSPDSRRTA